MFTARFGRGSGLVRFDRLCRENGVRHLLTAPRSPTTTGKVERFHKAVRAELLTWRVFASIEEAQAELDRWVEHFNSERPYQDIRGARGSRSVRSGGQDQGERLSAPRRRLGPAATAVVGLDDALRDGEAEPASACGPLRKISPL